VRASVWLLRQAEGFVIGIILTALILTALGLGAAVAFGAEVRLRDERARETLRAGGRSSTRSPPFFEFAPANGAGMPSACGPCANFVKDPQALDSANWSLASTGAAIPTRTANAATAPDGTLTAERLQVPLTTAAQYSYLFTAAAAFTGANPTSCSVYVKGVSGAGTIEIGMDNGVNYFTTSGAFTATDWTVIKVENKNTTGGSFLYLGNLGVTGNPGALGATGRSAVDVYLWGAQCNAGATANVYSPVPTGSKGELLTFNRASTAWCSRANELTGIVNGDLIECASGAPRVMPGGAGTGPVGLAVWEARTNVALRSQQFDDVAWVSEFAGGVGAATRTANFATAPDGTLTADRLQFPAVSGVQYSLIKQTFVASTNSAAVYVKGNGTSGTLAVWLTASGGGCQLCAYNSTTWTRCKHENAVAVTTFYIGNDALDCGTLPANDVLLWQADQHAATFIGPPITTLGTSATRVTEQGTGDPSFTIAAGKVDARGSFAATVILNGTIGGLAQFDSTRRLLYVGSSQARMFDGTTVVQTGVGTYPTVVPTRLWSMWSGLTMTVADTILGTTATGVFTGTMQTGTALQIGAGFSGGGPINGVIKQVCLDPNPSRCR
jgi:hypothetical protein